MKNLIKTVIEVELKKLNESDPYFKIGCGNTILVADEDKTDYWNGDNLLENDIIVSYDYCDDELSDKGPDGEWNSSDAAKWYSWYEKVLTPGIYNIMSKLGYDEVDEMDGSGGGLFYGVTQFRMPKQH